MLNENQKAKKKRGLCVSPCCRKRLAKGNNYCHKHIQQKYRENNPIRYSYNTLKQNSKRRGKIFDLTFDDFITFLKNFPEYISGKGRTASSLHIDRIDVSNGYTLDNLQLLTNTENVRKQHYHDYSDNPEDENYCPF